MDDLTNNRYLPFPKEDFDKNGNLKKVRSRMLKKLLKYEFKSLFKKLVIPIAVYLAVAVFISAFGFLTFRLIEKSEYSSVTQLSGFVYWLLGVILLVYGALFLSIFPLIISLNSYGRSFFRSQGYLTHSIPATPEEQVLTKRICAFVTIFTSYFVALLGLLLAIVPLIRVGGIPLPDLSEINLLQAVNDLLYATIAFPAGVWVTHSVCGFFRCWFHRGLKVWVFILMLLGAYFLSLYGVVFLTLELELSQISISPLASRIINWGLLAGSLVLSYFIFRFEANTLRRKINLK